MGTISVPRWHSHLLNPDEKKPFAHYVLYRHQDDPFARKEHDEELKQYRRQKDLTKRLARRLLREILLLIRQQFTQPNYPQEG